MDKLVTVIHKFIKDFFVVENFLPIGLILTAIFSLSYSYPGAYCSTIKSGGFGVIEFINNIIVFLISGITLKIEELSDVIRNHKFTIVYGIITINFITTLLAFAMQKIPFQTAEFATGLTLFATVPTTLGVGVALTGIAKGDQILSLFLTVSSNMLGIITVPFLLKLYLQDQANVEIDANALALKLTYTVLIPTIGGMTIRHFVSTVPAFTKQYRAELSMFSSFNLLMIVWMALSSSQKLLFQQSGPEIVYVFLVAIGQHCFYLIFNYLFTGSLLLNIPLKQRISIVIMASQKSSPVALAVITNMTAASSSKGLFALPCLIGQLTQIFIGSYVARQLSALVTTAAATIAQQQPEVMVDEEEPPQQIELMKRKQHEYNTTQKSDSNDRADDEDDEEEGIENMEEGLVKVHEIIQTEEEEEEEEQGVKMTSKHGYIGLEMIDVNHETKIHSI